MKRFACVILLICSAITLCSCAGISRNDASERGASLEPQSSLKFTDIPAPVGLKFIPEESYSFESAGIRAGVLKYKGKADIEEVVNFYKDQMPLHNWNLLNTIEYGQRLLNFDREQESCIVNLSSRGRNVTVTISLGPKSAVKPKKADKPVK
jgi:hypothetical protein